MFSVSLTPAEVTRLERPRQDQSLLGRGHGLGLAEPLGPRWEDVIGTLAHGGHSSPFRMGFLVRWDPRRRISHPASMVC